MGKQAQTIALNRVLKNKIKHSKYIGEGEEEDTHFEDLNFKFSSTKNRKTTYLKEFMPAIYYEWSKRQTHNLPMFLSCVFIRNKRVYISVRLDVFNPDSTNTLERLKTIDDMFRKFYFEDMKVYFVIEHPVNVGIWRKTKLKKFLFEQKEADLNSQIEIYKDSSGRAFKLYHDDYGNVIESLNRQIRVQNIKINELRAQIGIIGESYFFFKKRI